MGRNRTLGDPHHAKIVSSSCKTTFSIDAFLVDTKAASGPITIGLDSGAVDGDRVEILDVGFNASKHPISITPAQGQSLAGWPEQQGAVISVDGGGAYLTYNGSLKAWTVFMPGIPQPHLSTTGARPGIQVGGSNIGARGLAGVSPNANDNAGKVAITAGADSVAGEQAEIIFAEPYGVAPRAVILTPGNAESAAAGAYVSPPTKTGFSIHFTPKPGVAYVFYYLVVG